MDQNVIHQRARDNTAAAQPQHTGNGLAPGKVALPILLLLMSLQLPEVVANMQRLWPIALRVYVVTLMAYWVRTIMEPNRRGRLVRVITSSVLPLLLLFPSYLTVTALFNLDNGQVQLLLSIGLSVTYFNLGAVIFSGSMPLDGGKKLPDGRRLFGDGKTVQGTVGGLAIAMLIGWATVSGPAAGLLIGFLTMSGDLLASFVKRRLALDRGYPAIILDQLDSIIFLISLEIGWHLFGLGYQSLLALIMATFFVQVCGNYVLFLIGKKQVPW